MGELSACSVCGSAGLVTILNMGSQPLAERYGTDERYPLALAECIRCALVQLTWAPDPHEVFPGDHPYATGNSPALVEHFGHLAASLAAGMAGGDLAVDIGCNDGTLLAAFPAAVRRVGVEPTGQATRARARGLEVYQEFFSPSVAKRIAAEHGQAKVVTACNVLAHVPSVHTFMAGVTALLAPDGVFVTENHDLASVTEGLQIDTVYHEHLRYFSLAPLAHLLAMHSLTTEVVEKIPTHGGSLRVSARRRLRGLQARAACVMAELRSLVTALHETGDRIYGIGATTRATPLIHYAGIAEFITCVCEVPESAKIGLTIPGTTIPIVPDKVLIEEQPEFALLLSWHIADRIIPALRAAGYRGRFLQPLPEPKILGDV